MTENISKTLCAVFLAALALAASGPLCAAADKTPASEAGESIRGFSFAVVEEDNQKSIVEGRAADMVSEKTLAMTEVVCSIYQNAVLSLRINAPRAQADMESGLVTSGDRVVFTNPKGMNITGQGMHWDTRAQHVTILEQVNSLFPSTMFAEVNTDDET